MTQPTPEDDYDYENDDADYPVIDLPVAEPDIEPGDSCDPEPDATA